MESIFEIARDYTVQVSRLVALRRESDSPAHQECSKWLDAREAAHYYDEETYRLCYDASEDCSNIHDDPDLRYMYVRPINRDNRGLFASDDSKDEHAPAQHEVGELARDVKALKAAARRLHPDIKLELLPVLSPDVTFVNSNGDGNLSVYLAARDVRIAIPPLFTAGFSYNHKWSVLYKTRLYGACSEGVRSLCLIRGNSELAVSCGFPCHGSLHGDHLLLLCQSPGNFSHRSVLVVSLLQHPHVVLRTTLLPPKGLVLNSEGYEWPLRPSDSYAVVTDGNRIVVPYYLPIGSSAYQMTYLRFFDFATLAPCGESCGLRWTLDPEPYCGDLSTQYVSDVGFLNTGELAWVIVDLHTRLVRVVFGYDPMKPNVYAYSWTEGIAKIVNGEVVIQTTLKVAAASLSNH